MKRDTDFYLQQIKRAKTHKDTIGKEYEWDNLRNTINTAGLYVEGENDTLHQVEQPHTQSGFVNWPWAFKESFIPAVYSRQPEIYIYPKESRHARTAKNVQANINATLEAIGFEKEVKRALLDAVVFGHGWVKIGWYTRFGQVPSGVNADNNGKVSTSDLDMDMLFDSAYSYRVSPHLMHVDPDAMRYEDARWMAQEYFLPYENVQDDPFLKHTKDANAISMDPDSKVKSIFESQSKDSEKGQWARVYEIWDREEQEVRTLVEGCDKFSRVIKGFPYKNIRGFPFKLLTLSDAVDKLYPPSPMLAWYPLVSELSFIRQTRMDHMKKMVNKVYSESGAIEEPELEKLADPSQEHFEAVDFEKVGVFKGLQPDANLYACEDKIEANIRDIAGFSELMSGSVPYSKLTATTSQIAAEQASVRFRHATVIMSEFIKECAKDLFYIIRDYQEYPVTVRHSNDPNANLRQITRDQIEGEYDFRILVEDMSHISRAERVKAAYDELIALAPFKEVKKETLIRKFLEANGHINIDEYMYPPMGQPVDPMYENDLMSRGVPVKVNPREDFQLHLRVHNEWISSPAFQQLTAQFPAIRQLASTHIQETTRAFEEYQQENGGQQQGQQGQRGQQGQAGVNQQTQSGRQLNSSTPQGGSQNQAGPTGGASQLMEALKGR